MPFDIEAARKDGANDTQIKDFLNTYFDVDAAINDGASLEQLAAVFQVPPPAYTPELEAGTLGLPVAELQQREAEAERLKDITTAPKIDITPDWEKRIAEATPPPPPEQRRAFGFRAPSVSAPDLGVKTPVPPSEKLYLKTKPKALERRMLATTDMPLTEIQRELKPEYTPEPMKLDFEGKPTEEKPEPAGLITKPAAEPEEEREIPGAWKSVKGVLTAGTASWLKSGAMVGHQFNKALWLTVNSVNKGINDSFGTDLPTSITPPTADENPVYKFLGDVEQKNNIIEQRFGNETASSLIQKGEIAEAGKLLGLETLQSIPLLMGFAASASLKIPMLVPGAVLGVSRMGESQEDYLKRVIGGEKLPDKVIADFAALGKGAVETVFMTVGMGGIFNRLANAFKATRATVGKEAAEKMVSGVLVNMSKHALGEGRNAAATMLGMTMGQNFIDKVTGVAPELTWNQMVRNGIDATLAGFAMGAVPGAIRGIPEGTARRGVLKAAEITGLLPKPRERRSLKDLEMTASEYVDAIERDPTKYVFEDLHEGDKGVVVEEVKNRRLDADAKAAKAKEGEKIAAAPPPAPAAPTAPEAPKIAEAPKVEERPATPPVPPPVPPPAPAVTPKEGEAAVPPKRVAKKPEELTPDEVEELVNSDPMSPEAIKAVAAMAPTIPDESRPAVKKEKVEIKKKKQKTEAQKEREALKDEAEKQNYRDAVAIGYKPRTAEERMAVFTLKTPEEAQTMNALVREIDKAEANREMWEPQQLAATIKKYEDAGFDSKIDDFGVKQKIDTIRQQLHDDGYTKSGQPYEFRDYLDKKKVFTQMGIAVEGEGGYMTAEKVRRRLFVADENELKQIARDQIQGRRKKVAATGGVSKKKGISEADIAKEVEKIRADNIVVTDSELQARARATLTARKEKITESAIRKEVKRLRDEQQDLEWESEDDARREIANKNEEAASRRAELKKEYPDGDMEEVNANDWNALMADLKKVLPNTDVGQWRLAKRDRLVVGAPLPRPSTDVGRAPETVRRVTSEVLEDYFGHYKPENLDIVLDTEGRLARDVEAEIELRADGSARITISRRLPRSELRRILVHEIAGHFGVAPLIKSDPRIYDVVKRLFEEDRKYFQDTPLNRITEELRAKYGENWLKSKELKDYIERVQVFHTYKDATPDVLMDEWIAKQIELYDAGRYNKANVTTKGMIRAFFKRLLQRFGLAEYTRTEEIDAIIRDVLGRLKEKNEREKPTTLYAVETKGPTAPPFYSVLSRAFENAPPKLNNLLGKQWIQWLESNKGNLGIKNDEIEWTGIKDFLQLMDEAPVERKTILDYLGGRFDVYEGQTLFAKEAPEIVPKDEPAAEIPEQERVRRAEEHIYGRKAEVPPPPTGGPLVPKPPAADPFTPEGAYESFTVAGEGIREWFKRKVVDEFQRLGFIQRAIQQARKIPEAFDAYLKQEIMQGKTKAILDSFRVNFTLPLEKAIHDAGLNVREVGTWLYARHAKERNASIAKINPVFAQKVMFNGIEQINPASGMFDVIADAIIKQMSVHPEKLAHLYKIEKMVKTLNTYHEYVLQKYGLVGAETIAGWNRAWKNYVPLKGFQEIEDAQMLGMKGLTAEQIKDLESEFRPIGGTRGFSVSYKPKTAMGRETMANADTILSNILTQVQKDIITANRNEVGRAFLGLVMENPNNKVWEIIAEPPKIRIVDSRGGGKVRSVVDPNWKRASNVIAVKVNGEDVIIRINDDALASAMKNMGAMKDGNFAKIVRTAGAYNRFLAGMITRWSPEFVISNFQRDLQEAMINVTSEHSAAMAAQIAWNVPRMMKGMYGHLFKEKGVAGKWILKAIGESGITDAQKWAREFSENGGTVEFVNFNDLESVQKRLVSEINSMDANFKNNLKKFVFGVKDFVDVMNSAVENGTRLACYKVMREHGYTPERAAQVAKNLTVNFNRKGEWGAFFNSLYMFANAATQGTRRALQILKTPKGVAFTVGLGMMGAGFAEWGRMVMGDENYEKIPLFTRTRNWIIPKADGAYYKIPLPFNFGVFYATGVLFESMTRGAATPEQATANILSNVVGSFNPLGSGNVVQTMFPTAIRWIEDYRMDTDFAGNPIYPKRQMYEEWKPESQLYFKGVTAPSKYIAEKLNQITGGSKYRPGMVDITPEMLDYFVKQQIGGLGDFLMKGVSSGWKTTQYIRGVPGAELPETREIPFVRRFKGAPLKNASKGMFFRKKDELQATWEEYTDLALSDSEAAKAFLDENQNEIMAYNLTRYVNTAMSRLNKIAEAAHDKGDTAGEQKVIAQQTDFLNTWSKQMDRLGTGILSKKKTHPGMM